MHNIKQNNAKQQAQNKIAQQIIGTKSTKQNKTKQQHKSTKQKWNNIKNKTIYIYIYICIYI